MQNFKRGPGCVEVYWGRDPHQRLELERTADKIKKGLEDQLRMNGRPAFLWRPVAAYASGTVPCTCDKDTTQNSDFKCISCFGVRSIPGYRKFMHTTLFYASAEFAGYVGPYPAPQAPFTLTNVVIDRTKKPNRLMLAAGATTGTIVTVDKSFSGANEPWEVELAAYKKVAGDTVLLEFSTDGGVTYHPVTLTGGPVFGYRGALTGAFAPTGAGTLRFRITLTRTSGMSVESPSFEIVRARFLRSQDANPLLLLRSDYAAGQILILKTWEQEMVAREIARGRTIDTLGDRSWTAGLDFFDTTITADTPEATVDDREAGPHPFFEYATGVRLSSRYAMYAVNLDSTIDDVMSHQSFSERRIQPGELYALVF